MPGGEKLSSSNVEEINDSQEQIREQNARLGAKILAAVGYERRQKEIVDSSFNKALKQHEKLPGKNSERRDYAYLTRLEKIIRQHGNKMEKRLWEASVSEDLLLQEENITEAYWTAKKQELRDNGRGDVELTPEYKHQIFEEERKLQEDSLESWINYLSDENSPYPIWFKVYAWDGMTKMGRYSKEQGRYETRNKTTVAPYPAPDAEILSGVFEVVNRFYGNDEKQFYTEDGERNIKLEEIVKAGNFGAIYNAIQQNIAPIIEPPEKAEDVQGSWIEYRPGDEQDIARAARGTGWCVATPAVGRHYLTYGTYGQTAQDEENDYTNARFFFFHPIDPKTGKLARNACASIRLDPDGNVAEISGLKAGQALNDSLVPTVEEKVKTLPGGKEFLPKLEDKQALIRLDHKMQNNEELTKEDLEFLYEIKHRILTLDTYNEKDPRIPELRDRYNEDYAKAHGVDTEKSIAKVSDEEILDNLDHYQENGLDINRFVLGLKAPSIVNNLDTLINHGANIDINELVSNLNLADHQHFINNLDALIKHGANMDNLILQLSSDEIGEKLGTLLDYGADINDLMFRLLHNSSVIVENLDILISHGAKIDMNDLVSNLYDFQIIDNLDTLTKHGAEIDVNDLASRLSASIIVKNLDALIRHGAKIDMNDLVSNLNDFQIIDNLNTLTKHGAEINVNDLASRLSASIIIENLDALISHGIEIDINGLIPRAPAYIVTENLDTLISHGAKIDMNDLVSKLNTRQIINNLDTLLSHGANIDINGLIPRVYDRDIIENLATFINYGADVNSLIPHLSPHIITENRDILISHGAKI